MVAVTINWLESSVPGFGELSNAERDAMMHFVFLWSLFEFEALDRHGDVNGLVEVARQWADAEVLTETTFAPQLAYFRDRYCPDGVLSEHFAYLNLRGDERDRVETVLRSGAVEPAKGAAAVLTIVYRFRNNLFHGEKWEYQLKGQHGNFTHANEVLMRSIELQRAAHGVIRDGRDTREGGS